ncbi:ATP-binding protein [Kitasatospora sp. NPDC008115]|uniref:ATP-binding protein n=1 Tax=Kitasatospora sp. NPDC008115 TaxID=3364022 RepID=UPI0036EED8DC
MKSTVTRRTPASPATPMNDLAHEGSAPDCGVWAFKYEAVTPETVRAIRRAVTTWCLSDIAHLRHQKGWEAVDALALVLDELVANVARHAPGPASVVVLPETDHWAVLVFDSSPCPPAVDTAEPGGKPSGLGLHLVDTLTEQRWGWFRTHAGKGVWAHCSKPTAA